MEKYWAEIIAPTGIADLPVGAVVPVVSFNHVAFAGTPTITVSSAMGPAEIYADCARIVSGAAAKAARAEAKQGRRKAALTARSQEG